MRPHLKKLFFLFKNKLNVRIILGFFLSFAFRTVEDFEDWTNWLFYRAGVGAHVNDSWEAWWNQGHV